MRCGRKVKKKARRREKKKKKIYDQYFFLFKLFKCKLIINRKIIIKIDYLKIIL